MPKVLSIVALAISILVLLVFAADLILGLANRPQWAPLGYSFPLLNGVFVLAAAIMIWLSWNTFREQR